MTTLFAGYAAHLFIVSCVYYYYMCCNSLAIYASPSYFVHCARTTHRNNKCSNRYTQYARIMVTLCALPASVCEWCAFIFTTQCCRCTYNNNSSGGKKKSARDSAPELKTPTTKSYRKEQNKKNLCGIDIHTCYTILIRMVRCTREREGERERTRGEYTMSWQRV